MNALQILQQRLPQARPRLAIVLGSGWTDLACKVKDAVRISYADLPGFPQPTVQGHASDLVWGCIGKHEVVVLTGRQHTYETGQVDGMKLPLHALRDWGCEVLLQTNAAGSLKSDMPAGSLMVLTDHINFAQRSPLIGETGSERFVNMVNAYDDQLRQQALASAKSLGIDLHPGVYGWCLGPQFETPAEIRMCALLGADAVGMSTVPETIIARHAGMRVLAFSLITNMGAGLSEEVLSHSHTLSQAQSASQQACRLLEQVIGELRFES
jgi:purine-nucleoside phosphorylase